MRRSRTSVRHKEVDKLLKPLVRVVIPVADRLLYGWQTVGTAASAEPLSAPGRPVSVTPDAHLAAYVRQVGCVAGRSSGRPTARAGCHPVTGMATGGTP